VVGYIKLTHRYIYIRKFSDRFGYLICQRNTLTVYTDKTQLGSLAVSFYYFVGYSRHGSVHGGLRRRKA
jgi:hypothetical protein